MVHVCGCYQSVTPSVVVFRCMTGCYCVSCLAHVVSACPRAVVSSVVSLRVARTFFCLATGVASLLQNIVAAKCLPRNIRLCAGVGRKGAKYAL